ncbi:MAG: class I SAM-dependent methyltransferase [Spirochaetaceae bacterium]|jgi:hypothetical protein|nr:class I SAM-dependent methyltransferase [Spirochaetaceae bacterium]
MDLKTLVIKRKEELYGNKFYEAQWQGSLTSTEIILPLVLDVIRGIHSAVDFGCGTGVWLSVLKELGVNEIKGYDGAWVDKELLKIPKENFTAMELDKQIDIKKKYDIAISVEVAEHLPAESARTFVETLTKSSDIVLFSAAIPSQGGLNHINEQWPSYWYNIFMEYGYIGVDFLRKNIWTKKDVEVWYRQNIILYVKKERLETMNIPQEYYKNNKQIDIVHPELFITKTKWLEQNNAYNMPLWNLYKTVLKRTIKKLVGIRIYKLLRKIAYDT